MRESLKRFQETIMSKGLEGVVIASPEDLSSTNLRYLSGFTGSSAYLVVTPDRAWLLTDFRYLEQAATECPDFEIVKQDKQVVLSIAEICRNYRIGVLGFEADKVPYQMWHDWNGQVPVVWRPLGKLVEELRLVKNSEEVEIMRKAARVAGESLLEVIPSMVGLTEMDVALSLEMAMRRRGAGSLGFPTIVGSGERGALPHAHPTPRRIQPGDMVTIDFGAEVNGYRSDETVTVAIGTVSDQMRQIFDIVAEAQALGIEAAKPGATSHDVDTAVRSFIDRAGYGEAFGHGTGHGVGLDVHENPFAFSDPRSAEVLVPGMTLTVEPGIYLPGIGGVRLEDTLVITETGNERLTMVSKEFRTIEG